MPSTRVLTVFTITMLTMTAFAGCVDRLKEDAVDAASSALYEPQLREFDVYVEEFITHSPREGVELTFFAFKLDPDAEGTVPGPEIRVKEGDRVRVTLHGNSFMHTIHWHGLSLPWEADGVPYMTQKPVGEGETYVYEFTAHETGTYWYHCHVDAPTHVDAGMFGALIVEPADPEQDPPFDREETLILHEEDSTRFLQNPQFNGRDDLENAPSNPVDWVRWAKANAREGSDVAGFIAGGETGAYGFTQGPRDYYPLASLRNQPYYDTFMINGKSYPETEPLHVQTGETLRVRLINAGQLVHTMHLHGHHFLVTHKDGYPLPEAGRYHADTLMIGPGERYDVYVDANNPGIWDFHDHGGSWELGAYAANDHAFPGGMNTMLVYDDFEYAELPAPEPGESWTSGDYLPWAPSYKGLNVPPDAVRSVPREAAPPLGAAPETSADAAPRSDGVDAVLPDL